MSKLLKNMAAILDDYIRTTYTKYLRVPGQPLYSCHSGRPAGGKDFHGNQEVIKHGVRWGRRSLLFGTYPFFAV